MKPTLAVFGRRVRLLASEVLKNAEELELAQKLAGKTLPADTEDPWFQQLPPNLSNFFKKYPPPPFREYSDRPTSTHADDSNPFLPNKHPVTNRWHEPKYSLRRQSDLYKAAYRLGITHLLPKLGNNKKFYEEKYANKTPMAGSVRFKLHKWERNLEARQVELAEAVQKADQVIGAAKNRKFRKKQQEKAHKKKSFL